MKIMLHAHTGAPELTLTGFLSEVILESLLETLAVLPFLFLTYLFMEFLEHKAGNSTLAFLSKSGSLGPLAGSALGLAPQCAFSAVAANLYTGRVITVGTMLAVFLSTSDEMIFIMLGEGVGFEAILISLGFKLLTALIVGFSIDLLLKLMHRGNHKIDIDAMCENNGCHCERGILSSALHHTVSVTLFILAVSVSINTLIFFIGTDIIGDTISNLPVLSHLLAAIIGLIPGCATSVALTSLFTHGLISGGVMMAGLLSGAGVGTLILFKVNKSWPQRIFVVCVLVFSGFLFGLLFDLTGLGEIIASYTH